MEHGRKLKDDNGLVVIYSKAVAKHRFPKGEIRALPLLEAFRQSLTRIIVLVFDHVFVSFVIWIKRIANIINSYLHQYHRKINNKHSNFLF
jgi:hypothetical protein